MRCRICHRLLTSKNSIVDGMGHKCKKNREYLERIQPGLGLDRIEDKKQKGGPSEKQ